MEQKFEQELELEKNTFTEYIANVMCENHYTKFIPTLDKVRKKWRFTTPYTPEFEDIIITKTRVFIMTRKDNDLDLLFQLTKWISHYLAAYLRYAPRYRDARTQQDNFGDFVAARRDLMQKLFHEFPYIQNLYRDKKANSEKNKCIRKNYNYRKKEAERLGDGFVCRVTADGKTYVKRTTENGKNIIESDPNLVRTAIQNLANQH